MKETNRILRLERSMALVVDHWSAQRSRLEALLALHDRKEDATARGDRDAWVPVRDQMGAHYRDLLAADAEFARSLAEVWDGETERLKDAG